MPWKIYAEVSALARQSGVDPPSDPMRFALFRLLRGQDTEDVIVATAYDIFNSNYRHVMDALCLCAARGKEVESALELRDGVYAVYCALFFNRAVFRSAFEMRQYVESLRVDKDTKENYSLALLEGPARLLDRYRVCQRTPLDPQSVLDEMMGEAHSRAFEHRGRPLTSKVAQEAFKWGRAAASTASTIKQNSNVTRISDALAELEFALTRNTTAKTPEDLGIEIDEIVKS